MNHQKYFTDRRQAGQLLAQRLSAYDHNPHALVLALPRGGVPVGFEIATALHLPLDILLVRKLGVPGNEEYAMGAVANGGLRVVRQDICNMLNISAETVDEVTRRELAEIERRERLYHGGRPPPVLQGRIVILVDDGLATGATMLAAARLLRQAGAARIIGAVPVAAPDSCHYVSAELDEMISLYTPSPFYAVGLWYEHFDQTTDAEVIDLLEQARQTQAQHGEDGDDGATPTNNEDSINRIVDNKGAYRETGFRTQ